MPSAGGFLPSACAAALVLTILCAQPAFAASDVNGVIDSIRNWVAGVLAALATLFLTIGGVRYLVATGNPRAVEEGKAAIKSALIGYALAALAPMFVDILRRGAGPRWDPPPPSSRASLRSLKTRRGDVF